MPSLDSAITLMSFQSLTHDTLYPQKKTQSSAPTTPSIAISESHMGQPGQTRATAYQSPVTKIQHEPQQRSAKMTWTSAWTIKGQLNDSSGYFGDSKKQHVTCITHMKTSRFTEWERRTDAAQLCGGGCLKSRDATKSWFSCLNSEFIVHSCKIYRPARQTDVKITMNTLDLRRYQVESKYGFPFATRYLGEMI